MPRMKPQTKKTVAKKGHKVATASTATSEKKKAGRIENLTPWQKGQSGNPSGRAKYAVAAHACRAILALPIPNDPAGRLYAEGIAQKLAELALAGDKQAADVVFDRAEGRPIARVEANVTSPADDGSDLTPEQSKEKRNRLFAVLSKEEREEWIAAAQNAGRSKETEKIQKE